MNVDDWGVARRESLILTVLSSEDRKALLALATPRHYPTGKVFFAKGSPGDTLLLIDTGQVEISLTSPAGDRSIIAHLGPGDCVGEMAVLMGSERTADARAKVDVTGRSVTRTQLLRFLAQHPQATLGLVADLCRKLQATTETLAGVFAADGGTRLAKVLAGLVRRWGIDEGDGVFRLRPAVSQADLGDMAGLTRESVNRQIKAWEADGILHRDGRELVVIDPERLAALAG